MSDVFWSVALKERFKLSALHQKCESQSQVKLFKFMMAAKGMTFLLPLSNFTTAALSILPHVIPRVD